MAMTAIGYRPDAGSATCRMPYAPSQPMASPMAAPIASSRAISPSRAYQCSTGPVVEKATTRMTTGASLKPDSASSTPVRRAGERHTAQHGEDGRGVRRGDHGADQQRLAPVESGQVVRSGRGDPHAHRDADRRKRRRPGQRRFDLFPLGAQAALGEDHDQRGIAEELGQLGVVEDDATRAVLAYGDAYPQVDEQAGEPAARGEPHRGDRDEQYERADQQEFVEVVDSQELILPRTGYRGGLSLLYLVTEANNLPLLERWLRLR